MHPPENNSPSPFTAEEEAVLIDFFLAHLTEEQLARMNAPKKETNTNKEQT